MPGGANRNGPRNLAGRRGPAAGQALPGRGAVARGARFPRGVSAFAVPALAVRWLRALDGELDYHANGSVRPAPENTTIPEGLTAAAAT